MHVFQMNTWLEIFFVWPFKAQKALLDSIRLIMHEWLDDGSSAKNTYANLSSDKEMVFCYQNCSDLLWEKNVLKCGFCKKYFDRIESQTSWTLLSGFF